MPPPNRPSGSRWDDRGGAYTADEEEVRVPSVVWWAGFVLAGAACVVMACAVAAVIIR